MSAPRPYVKDPFHPLGSVSSNLSFLYIYESVTSYFFHVVRKSASLHDRYLTIVHVLFKHILPKVKNDYSRYFDFHTLRARSNYHKIHGIFVYAFAEQTKFFIISCHHIKCLWSCCVASKDPEEKASWSKEKWC